MEQAQPTGQEQATPVGAAPTDAPSAPSQESEPGTIDQWIRTGLRWVGLGGSSDDGREGDAGDEGTTEETPAPPAGWTPPATREEHERAVQSEVDRREAKRAREQTDARTEAEWDRIKKLAAGGDTWALGEIAQAEVERRVADEQRETVYGEFLRTNVPLFDKAFLDPILEQLPEEVWKPIVGEGLVTLEQRAEATRKALSAHRERAVADALGDETFVKSLLGSRAFRAAWFKSDAVRKQYLNTLRGDEAFDEPDLAPGTAVARSSVDDALRAAAGFG